MVSMVQFSVENFAIFRGPVCKILQLTVAKSSKFHGLLFVIQLSYIQFINFRY